MPIAGPAYERCGTPFAAATVRRECLGALLLLVASGGCTQTSAPARPVDGPASAPAPVASPAAPVAQVPRPPGSRATHDVSDAFPPPMGADLPTATTAASSADATSTGGEVPILRAVRVGQHDGHDRLVFEFDGDGLPAWRVEYVDRPITDCGAGQAVPVAGDAWLQVRFSGAHAHTSAGQPTSGPRQRMVNQPVLRELERTCDFEAEVAWVAGLARPTAYRPRVLREPARLVIDIAH